MTNVSGGEDKRGVNNYVYYIIEGTRIVMFDIINVRDLLDRILKRELL